jgi:hypothetical protein
MGSGVVEEAVSVIENQPFAQSQFHLHSSKVASVYLMVEIGLRYGIMWITESLAKTVEPIIGYWKPHAETQQGDPQATVGSRRLEA